LADVEQDSFQSIREHTHFNIDPKFKSYQEMDELELKPTFESKLPHIARKASKSDTATQ